MRAAGRAAHAAGSRAVEIVRRYAHLSPGHLAKHAAKLGTILSQAEGSQLASV